MIKSERTQVHISSQLNFPNNAYSASYSSWRRRCRIHVIGTLHRDGKIHLSAYLNSFREYTFHHCAWITQCFVIFRALRSYTLISMLLNVCKFFHHLPKHRNRLLRYNYDFRKLRATGFPAFLTELLRREWSTSKQNVCVGGYFVKFACARAVILPTCIQIKWSDVNRHHQD